MAKIMIVDDSTLMVAVIQNYIRKENSTYIFISAHSGGEAVQKYSIEKPDLVFMDITMPGMDGITAMEKILSTDPNAKIVMCTAMKEREQEERAKRAGCVGYITKPFSRADIINALNTAMNGNSR